MPPHGSLRPLTVLLAALPFLSLGGISDSPPAAASEKPNLLFILSDDHQYRALGAAGNREIETPNLDGLAAEGTRFSHCFVSNPICTPSRAAVLTGQYGFRNGVTFFGMPIREDSPRLPALLSRAGYTTAHVGKWHIAGDRARPVHLGFDVLRNAFLGGMHSYDSIPVVQHGFDKPKTVERNPTDLFSETALELLDSGLEEPFALFLWYTTPHDPRTPPERFEERYPPESVSLPPNFMPEPRFDPGTLDIRDEKLMPRPLDEADLRAEIGRYYGMISHMDEWIGRILEKLEARSLRDRTLIVFGGDNGLTLGAHGLLGKQTLYEEGVRVPLILAGPGVPRGATSEALVDLMDVMPTLCEAAGVEIPETVQGRSLFAPLSEGEPGRRDSVFCHYHDDFRSIRTPRFKLIRHLKTGREELFDLENDPFELEDLVDDPEHAVELEALRIRLARARGEAGEETVASQ